MSDDLTLRRAGPTDRAEVIRLLAASLGREDDPRYQTLYAWKHEENAFGPSPPLQCATSHKTKGRLLAERAGPFSMIGSQRSFASPRNEGGLKVRSWR